MREEDVPIALFLCVLLYGPFLWYSAELSLLASHMFVAELLDICELMLLFGNISVLL